MGLELLGTSTPERLEGLRAWALATGWTLRDPGERAGLMPLLVPLAQRFGTTLGLLRWPTPDPDTVPPVVRTNGWQLHLVAPSVDALLHRVLVEQDAEGTWDDRFAEAVDPTGALYSRGMLGASRLPLPAYLLMRVGMDHDFFARLIDRHFERGDVQAALVTGDRVARSTHGFARGLALRAHSLERAGKLDEARDAARVTLLEPVWTLGEPFAPFARLAGWSDPITSIAFKRLADDDTKPPADRAAHRLDQVAVDQGAWDDARPELEALYREAGLEDVATLVNGA